MIRGRYLFHSTCLLRCQPRRVSFRSNTTNCSFRSVGLVGARLHLPPCDFLHFLHGSSLDSSHPFKRVYARVGNVRTEDDRMPEKRMTQTMVFHFSVFCLSFFFQNKHSGLFLYISFCLFFQKILWELEILWRNFKCHTPKRDARQSSLQFSTMNYYCASFACRIQKLLIYHNYLEILGFLYLSSLSLK